ncbi:hypothetical protein QJQ45_019548 [Haematococcus lacustris]|nr:hypothetical protein QJQ45_019548 [Haematococcus lacustris]
MASLTPLGATLLAFAKHEEPSRKLQEFRPHAERMVAAAASGICSAWSVEVSGSIASGTATRDSDLDLLIRTSGNDATREQRMQLRRNTVDRFMACPLVKQQASVTEKVREKGDRVCVTWYQEGLEVCVDLVFDSKTHGPIVARGDASKFDSVPYARQAVKLFKVMMASNPNVPEVAGYLVEGIATYCLASRAQSSPDDSITLFLDMCDYVGSRSQQHQQFNSDLLPILPTPKIMAAGQLRSLAQHASNVLNLFRRSASALQAHMLASHGLQMTVLQQLGSDNGLVATASLQGNNTTTLLMPAASSQPWSLNPLLCDECNRSYPSQQALADHKHAVHIRVGAVAVPAPTPGTTRFSCSQCNRLYGSVSALEAHVRAVHQLPPAPTPAPGHNPVPCPHCDRTYKTQAAMEQHVAASHNLATTYPSSGPGPYTNPFPCTNCQRSFTSAAALAAHRLQQQH